MRAAIAQREELAVQVEYADGPPGNRDNLAAAGWNLIHRRDDVACHYAAGSRQQAAVSSQRSAVSREYAVIHLSFPGIAIIGYLPSTPTATVRPLPPAARCLLPADSRHPA